MSGKKLNFGEIKINKTKFRASKKPINLNSVTTDKIVVSARLNTVTITLNILLVIQTMILLDLHILHYLK